MSTVRENQTANGHPEYSDPEYHKLLEGSGWLPGSCVRRGQSPAHLCHVHILLRRRRT